MRASGSQAAQYLARRGVQTARTTAVIGDQCWTEVKTRPDRSCHAIASGDKDCRTRLNRNGVDKRRQSQRYQANDRRCGHAHVEFPRAWLFHSAPMGLFWRLLSLCRASSGPVPPKVSGISESLFLHLIRHLLVAVM